MIASLTTGIILGLSAGFSPGPLLTFVITQTLKYDIKEGIKVALSPLISDVPVILISTYILTKLQNFEFALGIISFIGGLFILHLSYGSIKTDPLNVEIPKDRPGSLIKGTLINILSPHPLLFWFTVGVPTMLKANEESTLTAILFIISFYLLLVGSKILIANIVGKFKLFLQSRIYMYIMRLLGIILFVFAITLIKRSFSLLGIL